jgi:hypothetical protein
LYDQFVEICWWVVTKIPPLLWIVEVADKLEQSSRLFRIAVATFSAAGFLLYVLIQNPWKNLEPWVLLITAAIGALVGWFLPPVLAFAMALAVYLVVLGLLAVTSVFVIWFVYRVIFYPS